MSHTLSRLYYHCIFSTKDRRPTIADDVRPRLYGYIRGILRRSDAHLIVAGGTADHVHLLLELTASMEIADAMRLVKTNSSKWLRETFPSQRAFAWQGGYAAFTVSASAVPQVTRYIEGQQAHHKKRTFDQEFTALLRRPGPDDPRRRPVADG